MNKKNIIANIVKQAYLKKEGHIPSSLSILDILFVLYDEILNIQSIKDGLEDRDRFVLSKGHASLGLYAVLNEFNLLNEPLENFAEPTSLLGGHPTDKLKNIEASTGSLGHGLPMAVGMALGYKIRGFKSKVYCLIGDGEANEGTVWESALLAAHHRLDNLYCIMDHNRSGDRALIIDDVVEKFKAFNWLSVPIDGHDDVQIRTALKIKTQSPYFICANTIKGKGIPMMENNPEWHHKFPANEEELNKILGELND